MCSNEVVEKKGEGEGQEIAAKKKETPRETQQKEGCQLVDPQEHKIGI